MYLFLLLLGLIRQGARCKVCKMSVHHKCRDNVPYCPGDRVSIDPVRLFTSVHSVYPNFRRKCLVLGEGTRMVFWCELRRKQSHNGENYYPQ